MSDIEREHTFVSDEERPVDDEDFVAEAAEVDEEIALVDQETPRVDGIEQHLEVPLPAEDQDAAR
jgi:hypothetical protein